MKVWDPKVGEKVTIRFLPPFNPQEVYGVGKLPSFKKGHCPLCAAGHKPTLAYYEPLGWFGTAGIYRPKNNEEHQKRANVWEAASGGMPKKKALKVTHMIPCGYGFVRVIGPKDPHVYDEKPNPYRFNIVVDENDWAYRVFWG